MNSEDLLPGIRGFHTHGGDAWAVGSASVSAKQAERDELNAKMDAFFASGRRVNDSVKEEEKKPDMRKDRPRTKELTDRQHEVMRELGKTGGKLPHGQLTVIAGNLGIDRNSLKAHLRLIEKKGHIEADGKDYKIIARDS